MNNLNVHPIFVHFPVALLTIYCLLEFVRLRKVTSQPYWFYIKAMFVIIGSLATAAALITGDMAEDIVAGSDRALRHFIIETRLVILLAFVGLAVVTITGSLGGAVAFGPNIDPVVHFIYQML